MKKSLITLLTGSLLLVQFHGGAVTCEAEFGHNDCDDGKVTYIDVDTATLVTQVLPPIIVKKSDEYDRWKEQNCCSPNRTHTMTRSTKTIWIGTVGFEADLTSLVALVVPAQYALDGAKLTLGGSSTVDVQQGTSDVIQLPRCSSVDVIWGAAHQETIKHFEGTKTCKYPKTLAVGFPGPIYTYIDWRLCGYFVDQCRESITELFSTDFFQTLVPVQPDATACGTANPNPCQNPQNHACAE
jgi:hypothetical protein